MTLADELAGPLATSGISSGCPATGCVCRDPTDTISSAPCAARNAAAAASVPAAARTRFGKIASQTTKQSHKPQAIDPHRFNTAHRNRAAQLLAEGVFLAISSRICGDHGLLATSSRSRAGWRGYPLCIPPGIFVTSRFDRPGPERTAG